MWEIRYRIENNFIITFQYFVTGWLYDMTGNYDIAFLTNGVIQVIGGIFFLLAALTFRSKSNNNPTIVNL